jgi:serine/threonine protein kinase
LLSYAVLSSELGEEEDHEAYAPPIGTVLEGRYELVEKLGEGGVGWVYRALHLRLKTEVAIKMLQAPYDNHESLRPRFEREARALANLRHPNIVTLTDYSVADGRPYLVMELLEGQTLADRLEDGPVSEERARRIVRQVLDALIYAHGRGFAHRDLKPSNIFLVELPTDPDWVKILDFGFVKLLGSAELEKHATLTRSGMAFGTPAYMCPEQATGGRTDPRADLYAIGVVLFEMLAGRRPFVGEVPEVIRAHLTEPVPPISIGGLPIEATPELHTFLELALAKLPNERYATARAMREALDALPTPMLLPEGRASSETVPPPEPVPVAVHTEKRSRAPLIAAVAVAIALPIIAGSIAVWAALDSEETNVSRAERAIAGRVEEPLDVANAIAVEPPGVEPPAVEPPAVEPPAGVEPPELVAPPEAPLAAPALEIAPLRSPLFAPSADDPWSTLPAEPMLMDARAVVLGGEALSSARERELRDYARDHRDDPRAHLVLAQHFMAQRYEAAAMERYALAQRVDPRSRHDPRMLADLVTLASHAPASRGAARVIQESYGPDALPEIERRLSDGSLDRRERERLRELAARLRSAAR